MLRIVLIVLLILMLLGSLPIWTYSTGWGYYPTSGLGIVVIVLLLVAFRGRSKV